MHRQQNKNQDKVKNNWYVSQVANFQVFHGFSDVRPNLERLGFSLARKANTFKLG